MLFSKIREGIIDVIYKNWERGIYFIFKFPGKGIHELVNPQNNFNVIQFNRK